MPIFDVPLFQFRNRIGMYLPAFPFHLPFSMIHVKGLYIVSVQWLYSHLFQAGNDIIACNASTFPSGFASFQFVTGQKADMCFGCGTVNGFYSFFSGATFLGEAAFSPVVHNANSAIAKRCFFIKLWFLVSGAILAFFLVFQHIQVRSIA